MFFKLFYKNDISIISKAKPLSDDRARRLYIDIAQQLLFLQNTAPLQIPIYRAACMLT